MNKTLYNNFPIFFFHIPKVGGNSIISAFLGTFSPDEIFIHNFDQDRPFSLLGEQARLRQSGVLPESLNKVLVRSKNGWRVVKRLEAEIFGDHRVKRDFREEIPPIAKVISGHFSREMVEEYKRRFPLSPWITIVRYPFERALSHLYYIKDRPGSGIAPTWYRPDMHLRDFLMHPEMLNYQGNMLAPILQNREGFAYVGTTDRPDLTLRFLENAYGLTVPAEMPYLNKGRNTTSLYQEAGVYRAEFEEASGDHNRLWVDLKKQQNELDTERRAGVSLV